MNNLNKSLNLVNLYKCTKDKYCYILNKKTNKEKTKKLNSVTKSQSCYKIDNYNYKNNNINYDSKIKYEKKRGIYLKIIWLIQKKFSMINQKKI